MAADNQIHLDQLARSFAAVGALVDAIEPDQWSVPTQCLDWTVHRLVEHLVGKNFVFAAVLAGRPLPQRGDGLPRDQLAPAYRESAAALLAAFGQSGVLERSYQGPLGAATGEQRLKIRMYDLLGHGWDLAQALGQPAELPEDAVEASLAFARADGRAVRPGGGCFGPPRPVDSSAPAIVRLAAFLGRDVTAAFPGSRLRVARVIRVEEHACEVWDDGVVSSVDFAAMFPSPRRERVSPGHLVAIATGPEGAEVVVWRWYDALVLGAEDDGSVRLWEPAHGEVVAQPRASYQAQAPGARAFASAGLPGAEWWVAGPAGVADPAGGSGGFDVDLDEVAALYEQLRT